MLRIAVMALLLASFALFLVHQLTLWLSMDPERAFHRARIYIVGYATVWDTGANIWNAAATVAEITIPAWNAGVLYIVEPTIFTALDIVSIAFAHRSYSGVITEELVPYDVTGDTIDGSVDFIRRSEVFDTVF